jgi:hypothetical protein
MKKEDRIFDYNGGYSDGKHDKETGEIHRDRVANDRQFKCNLKHVEKRMPDYCAGYRDGYAGEKNIYEGVRVGN